MLSLLPLLLGVVGPVPELTTPDPGALVAFYERVGATVVDRTEAATTLDLGGTRLRVARGARAADRADRAVTVLADDLAPWCDRAREAGVEVRTLRAGPGVRISLLVVDPDGYRVVFRRPADARRPAVPRDGDLNPLVLRVLDAYPTDGTHPYHWPKKGSWKGCTKDLLYGDRILCKGDPKGRAFCCGLTFEVLLDAWRLWCAQQGRTFTVAGLDLPSVRRLQGQWFGSPADKTCIRTALVDNSLGRRLSDWDDARPGDFVQLWRNDGTGHSVVFLGWVRDADEIVGIRYWSTQRSTNGVGRRTERFGPGRRDLDRDAFYLCRVGL